VQTFFGQGEGVSSDADFRTFRCKKLRIFRNLWWLSRCGHFTDRWWGSQFFCYFKWMSYMDGPLSVLLRSWRNTWCKTWIALLEFQCIYEKYFVTKYKILHPCFWNCGFGNLALIFTWEFTFICLYSSSKRNTMTELDIDEMGMLSLHPDSAFRRISAEMPPDRRNSPVFTDRPRLTSSPSSQDTELIYQRFLEGKSFAIFILSASRI